MTSPAIQDDWEQTQAEYAHLGDGLPLVPPTPERVARMLAHCTSDPDEIIATLAPAFGEASWRGIAENAVMAGCLPEYLPVIVAAAMAVTAAEYNLLGIQTTTGSAAPLVIVNGPIATAIGMNSGGNALGPGNRANASIGRAFHLVLQNIGGARTGEMDMATLGHPGKYTFCLAENQAESPWPPFHVGRGYAKDQGVATVVGAAGFIEVVDSVSSKAKDLIRTFASSMVFAGSVNTSGVIASGQPLLVLPPEQAHLFQREGMNRQDVQAALLAAGELPLDRLSPAVAARISAARTAAGEKQADAPLRIAHKAEDILIVVAGGPGVKAAYIPTWSGSRAVSREIQAI